MGNSVLKNLEPASVFRFFEEICGIPHGSRNTAAISNYLVNFAKEHQLSYVQDESGNVLIRKAGTPGYENRPVVIIQGHMDMVCEKRPDVAHDFEQEGLNLSVEEGYIHANGTTLGADDGVAVAMGLALLDSTTIPHPPLEVVFTVDEEIGLLGASAFDCSVLTGKKLINLDSEEEGILTVACAGGGCAISRIPVRRLEAEGESVTITIDGLLGGHSGQEINKNRANANILMGRFLYSLDKKVAYSLVHTAGGEKDNAIPRSAQAELLVDPDQLEDLKAFAKEFEKNLQAEYAGSDAGVSVHVASRGKRTELVLHPTSMEKILFYMVQVPFGVAKMSGVIEGLVETSSNIGILKLGDEELYAESSVRSSVSSAKNALIDKIQYLTEFVGGEFELVGAYPAWEYRAESSLRDTMVEVYKKTYGKEPVVAAIHAGLECGLFYQSVEDLDCVSVGPNIIDIHTSEEHLDIESTRRVWEYVLEVLKEIK